MGEYINRNEIFSIWRSMPEPASVASLTAAINRTPTVNVDPVRRGSWKPVYESEITGWNPEFAGCDPVGGYVCSNCNCGAIYSCNDEYVLSNYCPNCGFKMRADDDNNEFAPLDEDGEDYWDV